MEAARNKVRPAAAATAGVKRDEEKAVGSPSKQKPIHYPFWFGGSASSMAACVTHPLDLGKQLCAIFNSRHPANQCL
jgi:dicarboxylate transporter 10